MPESKTWRYFTREEFACKHCGENHTADYWISLLDEIRHRVGRPFIINSGYRCPVYNDEVSGTGLQGPHVTGWAADIHVPDASFRFHLRHEALKMGITRFGTGKTFLHLDYADGVDPVRYVKEVEWVYS